ncbi:hypothetical protein M433DRAFT_526091 [Acidomyces richmondensis BFW]|nr:MAG: hypothetical protein FE78DRAFT_280774 [Acidomyces sp. 'richmondensis']KYG46975.1 hypothetical protein M433DRAFT_526091 [Acidomyces richmondensis BFW]
MPSATVAGAEAPLHTLPWELLKSLSCPEQQSLQCGSDIVTGRSFCRYRSFAHISHCPSIGQDSLILGLLRRRRQYFFCTISHDSNVVIHLLARGLDWPIFEKNSGNLICSQSPNIQLCS